MLTRVVIVWINGAFGAGKTVVAEALLLHLPSARLFDPERVGFLLRELVEVPTGDFQDLPLWRELVVTHLLGLARHHPGVWVVPMALLHPGYREEILTGLRTHGVRVHQCVLRVPEDVLRARIDAAPEPARTIRWRHEHMPRALSELSGLADREPDTIEVSNVGRSVDVVAGEIVGRLRAWLPDSDGGEEDQDERGGAEQAVTEDDREREPRLGDVGTACRQPPGEHREPE